MKDVDVRVDAFMREFKFPHSEDTSPITKVHQKFEEFSVSASTTK